MAGHWIYAIPIAIGFLLKQKRQQPNQELQLRQQLYSRCLKGVLLVLGLALLIVLVHCLLFLSFMISVAKVTIKTFNLSLFATFLR
jgi:hypothetical protein